MVIFHTYVSLPEGISPLSTTIEVGQHMLNPQSPVRESPQICPAPSTQFTKSGFPVSANELQMEAISACEVARQMERRIHWKKNWTVSNIHIVMYS